MKVELEVRVPIDSTLDEELNRLGIEGEYRIIKKSLDARKTPYFLYRIVLDLPEVKAKKLIEEGKAREFKPIPEINISRERKKERILVVGSGPAGLFSALILSRSGYSVTLIERGKPVEERVADVSRFWKERVLDENSNVQFGEGGAGTFSDGKLTTRVKDRKKHFVLKTFVEMGAPEEILFESKPHVGTDLLRDVIRNFRESLKKEGVEFRFSTLLKKLNIEDKKVSSVILKDLKTEENKEESYDAVFLAVGNSARDTFRMLIQSGLTVEAKPFAVGLRVIHRQRTINRIQYGKKWFKHPALPPAEYAFTFKRKRRNVFTFCMCPGGFVICASSEKNSVVCNGMSNHARNSGYANSAVVVQVFPEDFGNNPLEAINFQIALERAAFVAGGSNYTMPAQRVVDFLEGRSSTELIEGGYIPEIKSARLDRLLPEEITKALIEAFTYWREKIPFFVPSNATLVGVETGTSSPIRIKRNKNYSSVDVENLFPIGEGAGYAGGITSSAIDGINAALAFSQNTNMSIMY